MAQHCQRQDHESPIKGLFLSNGGNAFTELGLKNSYTSHPYEATVPTNFHIVDGFVGIKRQGGIMFAAVSHQVVQSVGKDSLLPVDSLEASSSIKIKNVVIRKNKRHFLFWKKAYYMPYNLEITELLVDSGRELKVEEVTVPKFCTYNRNCVIALDGQFGAAVMHELMDVDLKVSDKVEVKADLGELKKCEVNCNSMIKALAYRSLNTDHVFVKQIVGNKKKVMCVVVEVLSLANDAGIMRIDDLNAEANAKGNIPLTATKLEGDGKIEKERKRQIGLSKGTTLAYNIVELKVNLDDGSIEPVIVKDEKGGFYTNSRYSNMDGPDGGDMVDGGISGVDEIKSTLQPLFNLDMDTRNDVKSAILEIMSNPSDIFILCKLIDIFEHEDHFSEESPKESPVMDTKYLDKRLITTKDKWSRLLEIAGIQFKTDGELSMPGEVTPLLTALGHVFDALFELAVELADLQLLIACGEDTKRALYNLCKSTMEGQPLIQLDESMKLVATDQTGRKIAEHIGYKFKETNVTIATGPETPSSTIEQIFWILYAFYG